VIDPALVPPPLRVQPILAPPLNVASLPLASLAPAPMPLDPLLTVRPRQLSPPDELTLDRDYIHQLQTAPVVADERDPQTGGYLYPGARHKPSRGGAFLRTVLSALAPSIANARAEAYAQGRAPGWDTLAAGAAGALGGGVVGAASPELYLKMQRDHQIAEAQQRFSQDAANAHQQANIENIRARPGIAIGGLQTKRDIADANNTTKVYGIDQRTNVALDRNDITAQRNSDAADFNNWRMTNGDKRTDGYLDFTKWRQANGDRNSYTREEFNQWRMDHGDDMADIAGQNADSNTTRAGAAVTNSRANMTRALRPPAAQRGSNASGGRAGANVQGQAATAINQLQSTRTRMDQAIKSGDKVRADALGRQLQTQGANIRSRFGNSVSDDTDGWPTRLQSPSASPTAPQGGGSAYAGRRISQSNLPAAAQRMGMSPQQAANYLTSQGAIIY
jgi:hypothetical protein